jgi:hypothetical protein
MKKLITIVITVLITASVFAQAPQKMSYQAVVRNNNDQLVTNQAVGIKISILQGSASGTAVYTETQAPTTNTNGLITLEIGNGITSDVFSVINWTNGPYFIKTETDPTTSGGTNYTITGTSQLLSVPYALHSKTAESLTGGITETDPIFVTSAANGITNTNISEWNSSFGWGNHATAGYLTSFTETDPIFAIHAANGITSTNITNWNSAFSWGNHATAGYLTSYTETDPLWTAASTGYYTKTNLQTTGQSQLHFNNITNKPATIAGYGITDAISTSAPAASITNTNITNWNSAFDWGNHAIAGYLTSYTETDPVWTVASTAYYTKTSMQTSGQSQLHFNNITNKPTTITGYGITDAMSTSAPAASITNTNITNWNSAYSWGNHATAGYLTTYTETDPAWTAASTAYYTKTNLQISGQSQLHFNNITNKPTTITGYGITDAISTSAPAASITNSNITNWSTAYSWGNHAAAGYLTSEVDGSVTNEIELPIQAGNSGKYLTTNGTSPSWAIPSAGSSTRAITSTSNYTVQAGDNVLISNAASIITYTLPSAAVAGSGAVLNFYGILNPFNINTSQTIYDINGVAQTTLSGKYIVTLVSDGVNKWCQIN